MECPGSGGHAHLKFYTQLSGYAEPTEGHCPWTLSQDILKAMHPTRDGDSKEEGPGSRMQGS